MVNISQVIHQLILLFLLMLTGYLCRKKGLIQEDFCSALAGIVINLTLPANIISAGTSAKMTMGLWTVLYYVLTPCVMYAIALAAGGLFAKIFRVPARSVGLYRFMMAFSNTGFIGYPVMGAVLGTESFVLVSIFNLPFNLLVYSFGIFIISGKAGRFQLENLMTPCLAASLFSIAVKILQVRLPSLVTDFCNLLGGITVPSAMLIVGSILSTVVLKDLFSEWRLYALIFCKQLLLPLVFWVLFCSILTDRMLLYILVLTAALPCAANTSLLCAQYGEDEQLASMGVFLSTALSFLTIPIVVYMLQSI